MELTLLDANRYGWNFYVRVKGQFTHRQYLDNLGLGLFFWFFEFGLSWLSQFWNRDKIFFRFSNGSRRVYLVSKYRVLASTILDMRPNDLE